MPSTNPRLSLRLYSGVLYSEYLLERIKRRLRVKTARRDKSLFNRRRIEFYHEFWNSAADEVGARLHSLGHGYIRATRGEQCTYILRDSIMLDTYLSYRMAANKPLMVDLIRKWDCPVPRSEVFELDQWEKAATFLAKHGGPVVVKPADSTGAGSGVCTGVSNRRDLKRAVLAARGHGSELMVEEQVQGASYRLLYLGGELIDAVRKDPPTVIGTGKETVRQLIEGENQRRLHSESIVALHPLQIDPDCRTTLQSQGYSLTNVPPAGTRVQVKTVVNQNAAHECHSVLADVHPELVELGRVLSLAFGLVLNGVDVITPDISRPLREAGGCINEVNAGPGLHHHMLVANPACQDLGARVLAYALDHSPVVGWA
jgi:D-alanine-D-alanine ligase-like ATP-grasp enzyme